MSLLIDPLILETGLPLDEPYLLNLVELRIHWNGGCIFFGLKNVSRLAIGPYSPGMERFETMII